MLAATALLECCHAHLPSLSNNGVLVAQDISEIAANSTARSPSDLQFIHIPKTGGQSVEAYGYKHGYYWGGCRVRGGQFGHPFTWPEQPSPWHCSGFHVPPAVFESESMPAYTTETFCFVRHPFTRAISEYLFRAIGNATTPGVLPAGRCTASALNEFIQEHAGTLAKVALLHGISKLVHTSPPQDADCHWIPQWAYVDGIDSTRPACKHIRRQEFMEEDFGELMREFGQEYHAGDLPYANEVATCKLPVGSLSNASQALLRHAYRLDFERFGYDPSIVNSSMKQFLASARRRFGTSMHPSMPLELIPSPINPSANSSGANSSLPPRSPLALNGTLLPAFSEELIDDAWEVRSRSRRGGAQLRDTPHSPQATWEAPLARSPPPSPPRLPISGEEGAYYSEYSSQDDWCLLADWNPDDSLEAGSGDTKGSGGAGEAGSGGAGEAGSGGAGEAGSREVRSEAGSGSGEAGSGGMPPPPWSDQFRRDRFTAQIVPSAWAGNSWWESVHQLLPNH